MLRLLLVIVLLIATAPASGAKPKDPAVLSKTHGYAVVTLPRKGWLELRSVDTKKRYRIDEDNFIAGATHGEWLPAGSYNVSRWTLRELQGYETVVIETGRVTDLGVFVPLANGQGEDVLVAVRHAGSGAERIAAITATLPFLNDPEPIIYSSSAVPVAIKPAYANSGQGLVADFLLQQSEKAMRADDMPGLDEADSAESYFRIALSAQPPQDRDAPYDASSNRYFAAPLGQVRMRTAVGEWSTIDSGVLDDVTAVEHAQGELIVGFADGAVRIMSEVGNWRDVSSHPEGLRILDVDYVDAVWMLTAGRYEIMRNGAVALTTLEVFRGDKPDFAVLEKVAEYPLKGLDRVLSRGQGALTRDAYWLGVYPLLHRYDLKTGKWSTAALKKIGGFSLSDNSQVITAFKFGGKRKTLYVSPDDGHTWEALANPAAHAVHFDESGVGRAVGVKMGAFVGNRFVIEYDPESGTWGNRLDLPKECENVISGLRGDALLCTTGNHSILRFEAGKIIQEFALN